MAKSRKRSDTESSAHTATATADAPQDRHTDDEQRDRIARRAYELYLSRGGGHGSDWDDWLAAERELTASEESPGDPDRSGRG